MNVRERLSVTTQLVQTRGRGASGLVPGTFPGGRRARVGRGYTGVVLDLVRVFS